MIAKRPKALGRKRPVSRSNPLLLDNTLPEPVRTAAGRPIICSAVVRRRRARGPGEPNEGGPRDEDKGR